jgi:sterol 3beta-glucosyltransferase
MKITILTYGSRGDVQPFLALAVGLQKAGHAVTLAAPHRFSALVAQYHIPFAPLAGDPEDLSKGFNDAGTNVFRMVNSMQDYVTSVAPQVVQQVIEASANADLLVHSFLFTTGGHSLARHLGLPDVSIQTFPMFASTGDYPNVAFPPLGCAGNYFSHWLATQIFWYGGNCGFRQIQRLLPDSFPRTLSWPFRGSNPTPLLFAVSPSIIPPSADWPRPVHVTGYFFLEEEHYQPPETLSNFLTAGTPPVCVSFGSMVHEQAQKTGQILLESFAKSNQRAIVLTGWGGWKSDPAPENILYLEAAPHSWLFPRCKAAIHHGGAGTTAAGLRAGIPNIVIPHAADQPFWGRQVHALSAGPAPIPIKKLTVSRFLTALTEAEKPAVIATAQALGSQIRAEDGIGAAIRLVEAEKARFSLKNPNL